jgi:hypothetical protein
VTLASSAALRYDASLQFLQLVSSLMLRGALLMADRRTTRVLDSAP